MTFEDQHRWDELGKTALARIEEQPQAFLVDAAALGWPYADMSRAMADLAGKTVLELGSGKGQFAVALAKQGARVAGIDVGPSLVELARRTAAVNRVSCEFLLADMRAVPFADGAFDHVVGVGVLHHLPPEGLIEALRQTQRVLRPGGTAFFAETIENSKLFDLLQNLVPVGKPGTHGYRPSILQRQKWREYQAGVDDRSLTDGELYAAGRIFRRTTIAYWGMLNRFNRLVPLPMLHKLLNRVDRVLTGRWSPIKRLSRGVLVTFEKQV